MRSLGRLVLGTVDALGTINLSTPVTTGYSKLT